MAEFEDVFREIILDHAYHPRHFGSPGSFTLSFSCKNPACGDAYTFFVNRVGEVIEEISFTGAGCSLSKASCSLLAGALRGKTLEEIKKIISIYEALLDSGFGKEDPLKLLEKQGEWVALVPARNSVTRKYCALFAWEALRQQADKK